MKVVNDRRRASRVPARGEVYLHTRKGVMLAKCVDLSRAGMSLEVRSTKRITGRVRVVTSFDGRLLDVDGVVARRRRAGSGSHLGVRFDGRERPIPPVLEEIFRVVQLQAGLARQAGALLERLPRFVPIGPQLPAPGATGVAPRPTTTAGAASAPLPVGPGSGSAPLPVGPGSGASPSTPAVVPSPVHDSSEPAVLERVPLGQDDGWGDEELETRRYYDHERDHERDHEPLPGSTRPTLVGPPGPARTGHTVIAPLPETPARTGATVLSPRVELDDDDVPPGERSPRRGRRRR